MFVMAKIIDRYQKIFSVYNSIFCLDNLDFTNLRDSCLCFNNKLIRCDLITLIRNISAHAIPDAKFDWLKNEYCFHRFF